MRLRSTQVAFFILLLCAMQVPTHVRLQWIEGVVADGPRKGVNSTEHRAAWATNQSECPETLALDDPLRQLGSAARAVCDNVWTMHNPARSAAAINVHSGLLRA